jgi:hypothetical protein
MPIRSVPITPGKTQWPDTLQGKKQQSCWNKNNNNNNNSSNNNNNKSLLSLCLDSNAAYYSTALNAHQEQQVPLEFLCGPKVWKAVIVHNSIINAKGNIKTTEGNSHKAYQAGQQNVQAKKMVLLQ